MLLMTWQRARARRRCRLTCACARGASARKRAPQLHLLPLPRHRRLRPRRRRASPWRGCCARASARRLHNSLPPLLHQLPPLHLLLLLRLLLQPLLQRHRARCLRRFAAS
jgi:hypothetical protein